MRGGFTVRVTQVRENRAYLTSRHVDVPWTNKNLTVKWERFVSKLEPGKKETYTAIITGPDAKKAVAEMVAAHVRRVARRLPAARLDGTLRRLPPGLHDAEPELREHREAVQPDPRAMAAPAQACRSDLSRLPRRVDPELHALRVLRQGRRLCVRPDVGLGPRRHG